MHPLSNRAPVPCAFAALLLALLLAPTVGAQPLVQTVGDGPSCDFSDLQTAVDFMAGAPGTDKELRLDALSDFEGVALEIVETSLTIAGGFADCDPDATPVTAGSTLIASGGSVIEIDGGTGSRLAVRLVGLTLTGATLTGDLRGGGLEIRGNVGVTLDRVRIEDNVAAFGGGVFIDGDDGATLEAIASLIQNNVADTSGDGGGIRCLDGARITARDTSISSNRAPDGFGGGLSASSGCQIAFRGRSRINSNVARNGGGIDALGAATRIVLQGAEERPVVVENNVADSPGSIGRGGGALLDEGATLVAIDTLFENNVARSTSIGDGGAVALLDGARFFLTATHTCGGRVCASLSDNRAESGAALFARDSTTGSGDTRFSIQAARIEGNQGRDVISARNLRRSRSRIESTVIAHNEADRLLFADDIRLDLAFVTVANNTLASEVLRVTEGTSRILLASSIVFEPGTDLLDAEEGNLFSMDCLLLNELVTPPAGRLLFTGLPRFVDPTNRDFRLGADSDAIDVCDASVGAPRVFDLGFDIRGIDDPAVPDQAGRFDLGAFERGSTPGIFADGFESGGTDLWPE